MSEPCLERLQTTWSDDLCKALHDMNIRQLVLQVQINVLSVSVVLPSMSKLDYLDIVQSDLNQELCIPASLTTISLRHATCSASFIHMLLVKLSSLHYSIECGFDECTADSLKEHVCKDACDMSNMTIWFAGCSYEFYELFRDTSLFDMKLLTADDVVLASGILPSLSKLQILQLWGNVFGHFDFQFPSSLRKLIIHRGYCFREWLCDLMISISSLGHPIVCQVYDLELLPICDFNTSSSLILASEMISIFTLFDMSNIELHVKTGSSEFFEMFRDTNIPTLWLGTTDAASHASQILPTLCNLQSLNLLGYFMDRCDLQLPVSLQTLIVQEGYCSPEWLCSLITALSSLGHPIICKLYGLELQSICPVNASSSQTKASEISNLISCDMSNIELFVKTGSNALFEMFRDTSLRTLWIGTAAAASHVSQILPTLCNLETLHLWGYYMDRCDLQLPVSLQTLTFQEVFCSTEWLCSLMISLSAIGHRTICKMYHLELQPSDSDNTSNMQIQPYEIISNLNSCDMSNINLHVETGSRELFELFRDTNLNRLSLGTATAASHVSQILPTLCNLEKLYLWGSYMDRCDLQMPVSLQTLIFQEVYCSTEWLSSLMKSLSSIGHRIICKLYYLEHQPSDAINISSSQLQASHLMSCDMSNIEIHVKTCSSELFEVFRDACIFFINN
ncbi:hypothetical protein DPMN_183193 [Dreissena polymorpha]|uniref:Uncharacterized protein n=2 Tax=Dreissena polymorpha TaxID=45954 RepID=A0A9D4DGY6_DREPO|nr:hypothetical protein DPMN_183193 [Dreissena polymorpha]